MKTGYPIQDVAYATSLGILLSPIYSGFSDVQTPDPFKFHTENNKDSCRGNGRWIDLFPLHLSLRVIRRNVHKDFTGHVRPVFSEKEVSNQKISVFSTLVELPKAAVPAWCRRRPK